MATQKITIEVEVDTENGPALTQDQLGQVKEAVERTIYEYDNFLYDILENEYEIPGLSITTDFTRC